MAFTVEDGTGLDAANTYVDVSYADTYHLDRFNSKWSAASQPQKQGALIRASEYLDTRFGRRLLGERKNASQGLFFPRTDDTTVPTAIKRAVCEYALQDVLGLLRPTVAHENGVPLKQKSVQIGPMTTRKTYATTATGLQQQTSFPGIDPILEPFLTKARVIRE